MPTKITMIGAGSIGFTRKMMHDILAVPELQDSEFAFTDINKSNLDMVTQLVRRDIRENKLSARLTSTVNRRKALEGADYIFSLVRVGGLEAFQKDIDIPLKYGVDQCVGDTLCAGGIMYAQRGIPVLLDFCKDIRAVASKHAILLNYSNPNAMLTWACNEYGGVNTVGLCHGVTNTAHQIAEVLGVPFAELDYTAAGINHQTWFLSLKHKGKELRHKLLKAFENHPAYSKQEKVRIDILRRFGYFCTESNGHVSEYVPWYRKRPREIRKWIDMTDWILGETGGYLRVCIEGRNWFETDFPNWLKEPAPVISMDNRSLEHGGRIVEAIETGRAYRGYVNVVNHGHISNLPDDCVVEIPGYVDRTGINACSVGELPLACAATCNASIQVQRMAVRAAVQGDVTLLKQAMLHDPLVGTVCNPPEIWQLTDEMLVEEAEWLPQYRNEISRAKKRLAEEMMLGTRKARGAARKKTKTITEMKRNVKAARRLAGAADKAAKP